VWGSGSYIGSNIIAQNLGGPALTFWTSDVQVVGNLVAGNTDGDYSGAPVPIEGEVRGDPLWFGASDGDFRLLPGSPAIDAGDPSPPAPAPPLDPDSTRLDIGPAPIWQLDPDLVYVGPPSSSARRGDLLPARIALANLTDSRRASQLLAELLPEGSQEPALSYQRTVPLRPRASRLYDVAIPLPRDLEPGPHLLRVRFGTARDSLRVEVEPALGDPALGVRIVE